MDIPYDLIWKVAKDYFEADFIESFIHIIEKRAANASKSFFQLIQKDNKPTLEFGCVTDRVLVDIAASIDNTIVTVARMSAFTFVVLQETLNTTHLMMRTTGMQQIFYSAVAEEYRKELREYANFLQSALTGE